MLRKVLYIIFVLFISIAIPTIVVAGGLAYSIEKLYH